MEVISSITVDTLLRGLSKYPKGLPIAIKTNDGVRKASSLKIEHSLIMLVDAETGNVDEVFSTNTERDEVCLVLLSTIENDVKELSEKIHLNNLIKKLCIVVGDVKGKLDVKSQNSLEKIVTQFKDLLKNT